MRDLSRSWGRGALALLVALFEWPPNVVLFAQTPAEPEFPAQVELVTVDAVVVDANGKPVDGLTKDDFTVEEDGQAQEILNFEAVSVPSEPAAAGTPPLPSSIATNSARERPRRAFAVVVDDLRLPGEQSLRVRRALTNLIQRSLGPGDALILGTTSGEVWWSAALPGGQEDLLAVLGRVKGRYVDPSTREHMSEYEAYWITHREAAMPRLSPLAAVLTSPSSVTERVALRLWDLDLCGRKALGSGPANYDACLPLVRAAASEIDGARRQRTTLILRAMAQAVSALAPHRGRTSILFLSPGFLQDEDLTQQDLALASLQAKTSVYFVDTRGLIAESGPGVAEQPHSSNVEEPGRRTKKEMEELNLESGGALALAAETGGFSLRNTNDLGAAAERIAGESRVFYLLGFHPPPGKGPKTWRKIRVTVKRSGVTVRARRGYRLDAATSASAGTGPEGIIPLRLASYVLDPTAAGRTHVVVVTEIDVARLPVPQDPEAKPLPLQLRLEATPRDGGPTDTQDVSLQPGPVAASERPRGDWRLARLEFALGPGVHGIRAFVRDPSTGRTGAVEERLVVPATSGFRTSTLVLSDQVRASGGATPSVTPVPVAHDAFSSGPGRPLLASFGVYGAAQDPATGGSRVETRFVIEDQTGQPVAAPPASPLAPSPEGGLQQQFALPPLPTGEYNLVVVVDDRVAGSSLEMRRKFSVEGLPAVPSAAATPPSGGALPVAPELRGILDRAGHYVLAYGREFSEILAEEECYQSFIVDDPARRHLRRTRAGVLFITLPGPLPWGTFRDVWEVDGAKVRDREERLGRLFRDSIVGVAASQKHALAILEESARYNLGPVRRTANIPTLALLFFHPDNQGRFLFELKKKQSSQGSVLAEVAFTERSRPTLVAGGAGEGAPVKGRAWIDTERGTVVKTDAEYDIDTRDTYHRSKARIVTEYRPDPKLGILVPDRMKETYTSLAASGPGLQVLQDAHTRTRDREEESGVVTVEATTRYSDYHRFGVTTEETFSPVAKKPQ